MSTKAQLLRVLYPSTRDLAFLADEARMSRLLRADCVTVEYNARNEPRNAVLKVRLEVARQAIERNPSSAFGLRAPVDSIVRAKRNAENPRPDKLQRDKGSLEWWQRTDMAGRGAGTLPTRTLHLKLGHREATA